MRYLWRHQHKNCLIFLILVCFSTPRKKANLVGASTPKSIRSHGINFVAVFRHGKGDNMEYLLFCFLLFYVFLTRNVIFFKKKCPFTKCLTLRMGRFSFFCHNFFYFLALFSLRLSLVFAVVVIHNFDCWSFFFMHLFSNPPPTHSEYKFDLCSLSLPRIFAMNTNRSK